ncbi:MAG: dihydrofolate reductase family protein [Candidatus Pacebacteria bacterium]|nr:dihydrofolate reductase family protein [Candidatus Paceibacterota bacterium]
MKVILYMGITPNGLIAKKDDSADFLTKEELLNYVAVVSQSGALVVGRRTYEVLSKGSEFREFLEAGVKIIAVSHNDFKLLSASHSIAHSPKEALELLRNFKTVIVAGGGVLNASFLSENLVDEMYLDIEPTLLGKGIPLFNGLDFEKKLEFIDSKKITDNEIQLHYKVIK